MMQIALKPNKIKLFGFILNNTKWKEIPLQRRVCSLKYIVINCICRFQELNGTDMLYKWAKDGICVLDPMLFIPSLQAETPELRSPGVSNSNFYTSDYFKSSPNKQVITHQEPSCFASRHPTSAVTSKTVSHGYEAQATLAGPSDLSDQRYPAILLSNMT